MKSWKPALLMALVVLSVCLAVFFIKPTPAQYHLNAISKLRQMHEPKSWVDYLSPNTWAWYLAARPNRMQQNKQMAEHYDWLVDSGLFETHDFCLHQRMLGQRAWQRLNNFVTNATFADIHWQLKTIDDNPQVVTVTACRKDMQTWDRIFSRFDTEGIFDAEGMK